MDPLSDVLSLLKPRAHVSAGLDAAGAWSIWFENPAQGIKCYAVVKGRCWLCVEGIAEPMRLEAGECFLMPGGRPFRLTSDPALGSVNAETLFKPARQGGLVTHNGGGEFMLIGSRFQLDGAQARILLEMLPPVVQLEKADEKAALLWSVERIRQELREPQPGSFMILQHLAQLMLLQALRGYLSVAPAGKVGWLFALADAQIGAAIHALHNEPSHRWTLQELSDRVGMSRSVFAAKFKELVGTPPMDYLSQWRMHLAQDRLQHSSDSVSSIGLSLGYESESAFSSAFKRATGCSPRQFARGATTGRPDGSEAPMSGPRHALKSSAAAI